MRSRRRQRRRASNEKLAGTETVTSGASRTTLERNADSKFDAVLAGASWRGHAQIDSRADRSRLGKPGRLRRFCASVALDCGARAVDCVSCCRTRWTTEVSCGQGAVWRLALLRARCGADMICSRRRQRRRTSNERLGDGRPGRRAAKAERSPQEHQIEVRRRNGRCKPARTRADRTLVLTEAGRGNSDGFVAFTGFFLVARCGRERCALQTMLCGRMLVECAERRGERHFLVEEASGRLAPRRELDYDACTSTPVDCEQREARR